MKDQPYTQKRTVSQENIQEEPIRVCHISTVHHPYDTRIFYRECCSLVKAGYEVHFVVMGEQSSLKNGVHIHACPRAPNRFVRMFFIPWVALWLALKTKAVIYHYHDPELMFIGFVLRWIFSKKVVFDIHETVQKQFISKEWIPKLLRMPIAVSYKPIERIFTHGQALIVANRGSIPEYPSSAYVVCNYPLFDENLFPYIDIKKRNLEVPLLIYVGELMIIRGAKVYVELAGELAGRGHNFRMMLIGPYTKELGEELHSRIKELNLEDKISITGRMGHSKAMEFVSQAAIGLCLFLPIPHNIASLSSKILEYMREGTPVLASDFEGYRYYVAREKAGRNVDPCDIDRVVDVCEEMLANRDELVAMGRRGMVAVRNKYNWSSESKVLLQCYRDLQKG